VPAPKRLKIDEKMAGGREPPRKLTIEEGDDEKTKERKRKLLKAFKTKQRLADKDAEQNAKASSWQAFRTGKAATKHKPGCAAQPCRALALASRLTVHASLLGS
jgi:survival-of-motor-neuron-related-splicing factor 30